MNVFTCMHVHVNHCFFVGECLVFFEMHISIYIFTDRSSEALDSYSLMRMERWIWMLCSFCPEEGSQAELRKS